MPIFSVYFNAVNCLSFWLHLICKLFKLPCRYENEETGDFYGGQLPPGEFYSSTGLYDWQALDISGDPVTIGKKKKRVLENLRYSDEPALLDWTACYNRAPNPDWTI